MLFDVPYELKESTDFDALFAQGEEWRDERDIVRALRAIGHNISYFPIHADVEVLISSLVSCRPDVVFFSCESVQQRRDLSHRVLGLLNLLEIPHTGADVNTLQLCSDKALSKKVLTYHNVSVPNFEVWDGASDLTSFSLEALKFPVIVKPLRGEGSEGIHQNSVTKDTNRCRERMAVTAKKHPGSIIVEEFIQGRELYVGIVGNSEIEVLHPREFVVGQSHATKDAPLVASFKAKWDQSYRKRKGIRTQRAKAISPDLAKNIDSIARKVRDALNIQGYGRLDLRVDTNEKVHVLEANPNPAISKSDDFATAAAQSGISYNDLIQKLIELGLSRAS